MDDSTGTSAIHPADGQQVATFAAGCFWSIEEAFRTTDGVIAAESGYTGGTVDNPTYEAVCSGSTGHAEAVRVVFDPNVVSYQQLVDMFYEMHNPTTMNRQGPDIGDQYRSAIFVHSPAQRETADRQTAEWNTSDRYDGRIVTTIDDATPFYRAEEHHQCYVQKQQSRPSFFGR